MIISADREEHSRSLQPAPGMKPPWQARQRGRCQRVFAVSIREMAPKRGRALTRQQEQIRSVAINAYFGT